ncbi:MULTISPECIES: efflux RND transporter periplasmic adaptor subunit [unclassified Spirosoma]|uniref:efflux RND transporter periplasmic adaptor subunit n=1 Tax=unclassified Spirosoma TaxID=2621999 RepID=UPI0009645EC5|nr:MULTISPECIES: efflux RND transporter periplasmic adaptor subunit [unclassified Spirosoma]MBN8825607.1 efflux RND transporter periplasmic adaptor subunit [Spirosoma sp.]OJW71689.1 MAG: efflux transporter periplasmic adaptor subunit [Spirosoma sp. 48-14]
MKKRIQLPAILVSMCLAGCAGQDSQTETTEKLTLPVVQLARQSTTLQRDYVTTLEAVRNVEIRARVSGFLEKIYVDEGQSVHQGQLLFSLNAAEYKVGLDKAKASLKSAEASAKTAEVEVTRVKLLVEKKIVSPSELDLAKAKLDVAKAQIEEAQSALSTASLRLAHASIRAPFDGVINRIPFKIGSLIEEGALLTTVSDIREVFAYFDVSEKEYLGFLKKHRELTGKNGQEVEMMLADETPYPHKGRIETMESVFEEESGTIAFRARFPNPQKLLKHGSSGKIRLPNIVGDALLVPQKAVFEVQDKNFVYVVDKTNKVKSRSFVPQARVGLNYIVRSGLAPGERVVYEGIQNIRDGDQIIPEAVEADSASAPATLAQQ